jgi:hypothetical protein
MQYNRLKYIFQMLLLCGSLTLFSCGSKNVSTENSGQTDSSQTQYTASGSLGFPADSLLQLRVFKTGSYPFEEVPSEINQSWMGLFKGPAGYYTALTGLYASQTISQDTNSNSGEPSVFNIYTEISDSSLLLWEPQHYMKAQAVHAIRLGKSQIYPGDTLKFVFENLQYQLFATGMRQGSSDGSNTTQVVHYKLYLKAVLNGRSCISLLVAHTDFDDCMTEILFAGDIDGDRRLDIILNSSRHYNMERPTLYLSKPAANDQVLKPMGCFTSLGC